MATGSNHERSILRRATAVATWLSPVVIVVEIGLVVSGKLSAGRAVIIGLALETLLGLIFVALGASAFRAYRSERSSGVDGREAASRALRQALPRPVATVLWREGELFVDIFNRMRGRQEVATGQSALPYWQQQRMLMLVMGALSVGEILLLGWLLPWEWLRLLALVLGLYGTLWIFGFSCAMHNRPHVLDAQTLELRCANLGSVRISLADVVEATQSMHSEASRSIGVDDGVVFVTLTGTTLVSLSLKTGAMVMVDDAPIEASRVRFSCDDPSKAVDMIASVVAP